MLKRLPAQAGVTLVEMMIAVAIAIILFALATPNFSTYLQNSGVRNAADAIQNGLMLARAEAVRRNTNVQFALSGANSSWTVGCETPVADPDANGVPTCPGSNLITGVSTTPASIQSRNASEGSANAVVLTSEVDAVTATVASTPVFTSALSFNGLGRVTSATLAPGDNAIFAINGPAGSTCKLAGGTTRCLQVIVTAGGQIRMCDKALSAPDAQAC